MACGVLEIREKGFSFWGFPGNGGVAKSHGDVDDNNGDVVYIHDSYHQEKKSE